MLDESDRSQEFRQYMFCFKLAAMFTWQIERHINSSSFADIFTVASLVFRCRNLTEYLFIYLFIVVQHKEQFTAINM